MTTLAELVAQTPGPSRGVLTSYVYASGHWNFVVELADPSAGAAVQWYDITAITDPRVWTGYDLTRGGDSYLGRYRASVVNLDLFTGDDSLAPWNSDTSATFGTHVELGPGLLIRAGFIRVDGGVVVEWNPRFTNKVEYWGDASYSQGKVRLHRITARDTMSSLVGVPLPARVAENWSDRMFHFLVNSGWQYGSAIYGAQFHDPSGDPVLLLPDRPASSSAINELDATLDPVGLIWYTNRLGQLVVRPRTDDTFHAQAFLEGATGNAYPGDVTPVMFAWWACEDEIEGDSDAAAYAMDFDPVQPFGFDKDEANVINQVVVTNPSGVFADDDAISVQRYDPKTLQANWLAENDTVAAQILETRRNAVVVARPLHTTNQLRGFFPGPARVDYLGYVAIDHRNNDEGLSAFGNGWLRSYREQVQPLGCDINWSLTLTVDMFNLASAPSIRPVQNLHLVGITDWAVEFGWDNPEQAVIPTHTQYRLFSGSPTLWLTTDYPGEVADAELWTGLSPETRYQFQVRLIRIEDGQIVAFSPSRSYNVLTAEAAGPVVEHDGDDVTVTPGPLDPSCELAVELQRLTPPATWTTVASDTLEDGEQWSLDMTTFPSGTYRIQTQEFCDGLGGGWVIDPSFTNTCANPARLATAPYNDADLVAYIPQVCGARIEEAISNQPMTVGNAYAGVGHDASGRPVLTSLNAGAIGYGATPNPVAGTDDITIACRVKIGTLPTAETLLWSFGGASIGIVASGAGYRLRTHLMEAPGTDNILLGLSILTLGTVYDLALRHDVSAGTLRIYVDGDEDNSTLGTIGARSDPFGYSIRLPANSWITDMAVWERVLDATELPGYIEPVPTDIPVFLNVASAVGTNSALSTTMSGQQTLVLGIACVTRRDAAESAGFWKTVDRYSGGSTGHDGIGGAGGTGINKGAFGSRSHIEVRQDFLNFYASGGDEYGIGLNSADHSQSVAFYREPYPWKVRQIANGTTAGTALSATFAAPVAANSRVVIGVACLSANSVVTGPVDGVLDGSASESSGGGRTSRMTSYRIADAMAGQTTRSVLMASATGGAAMVMIEVARDDDWDHALRDAIRSTPDLMAYYPLNSSLGNGEKNSAAVATLADLTSGGWTYYDQAAPDGRKYWRHVSGQNPSTNGDHNELTPWGNGGMTVGFMVRLDSLGALQTLVGKNENASNFAKEWEVYVDTNGAVTARTCINFAVPPASARQRTTNPGALSTGAWYQVIVRFGNGANDYPTIRINGVQHTGTTSGTSAANANSTAASTVGAAYLNSSSRALIGAIGHVFYCTTDISDAAAGAIETGGGADGWFIPPASVIINRQLPDPTNISPVKFDVVFSESVTGFTAVDVDLTLSSAPGTLVATIAGSGSTYVVSVSGMTGGGTVVASIPGGAVTAASGTTNKPSTSTDNSISYAASGMVPFFDPFNRPDYGVGGGTVDSLGADWSQSVAVGGGTFYYAIVSGQMLRLGTGANNAITHIAAAQHTLPGPDITVEFDLVANPGVFIICWVYNRYNFTTNNGYRLRLENNGFNGPNLGIIMEKIVAGVATDIGSINVPNLGSGGTTPHYPGRWRFSVVGSTIKVDTLPFIGGTPTNRLTITDSSVTVGSGVGFQGYSNTNANVQIIDNVGITGGAGVATAPVYKATGAISTVTATDRITLGLPAGWSPGDYAVAAVGNFNNTSASNWAAAGWTVISGTGGASPTRSNLLGRKLQAGDTNPTFIFAGGGGSEVHAGVIVTYADAQAAYNPSEYISTSPISGTEFTPTGFTTSFDKSIVVSLGMTDFYQPISLKSGATQGFTVRASMDVSGAGGGGFLYCDKIVTPAGPVTFPTYQGPVSMAQFGVHKGVELAGL